MRRPPGRVPPGRVLALIVAALAVAAALGLAAWRGNPGPLLILGAFAWAISRPP